MTVASDLVAATKRHLLAGQREVFNTLAAIANSGDTTLTFAQDVSTIPANSFLTVDLEIIYVYSVNVSGKTAVVQRAMNGSVAAQHASGSVVTVNPRFADYEIFTELNNELTHLGSPAMGLYQVKVLTYTFTPNVVGYDLASDLSEAAIISLYWQVPGTYKKWDQIRDYTVEQNADTSVFPSGKALLLEEVGQPNQAFRVVYKAPFTGLTALTTDVATTGLPTTAVDIPPLGAAMRLLGDKPARRNTLNAQGDTRRAQEVTTGDLINAQRPIALLYAQRVAAEAMRLSDAYPVLLPR